MITRIRMTDPVVERLDDGRVKLTTGGWSDVFDEAERERWARWYADMAERHDNPRYGLISEMLRALPPVEVAL